MTIRPATAADVDVLVPMGEAFLGSTYAGRLEASRPRLRAFAEGLIAGTVGASTILVGVVDGAIVGMIGLLVAVHPFSDERIAGELFWWVEPGARGVGLRLMAAAETWARAQGAARIQMVAPASDARVGRLYARRGYTALETTFQRTL